MLPVTLAVEALDDLVDGVAAMARAAGVAVAGGNITRSPGPLVVDVALTGAVRPRRILTRGGCRAGDTLFVTGAIGAAAAGLDWLRTRGGGEPDDPALAECVARHRRPEPRLRIGALLGRGRVASACMDLSDGLADAVRQVAEASGVGAIVEARSLPVHPGAAAWFRAAAEDPIARSVAGGDDYELLFAVPRRSAGRLRHVLQQARGVAITRIGELTAGTDVQLRSDGSDGPLPEGFSHFGKGGHSTFSEPDPGKS
jgi:thiamine-monophosphate kinase